MSEDPFWLGAARGFGMGSAVVGVATILVGAAWGRPWVILVGCVMGVLGTGVFVQWSRLLHELLYGRHNERSHE
jgi:hypothetical protein